MRVMVDIAEHSGEEYLSLKDIANRQRISMKYLEMIVGSLKNAELVLSSRGKEGGYKLARKPEEYSVGEILRCVEDNLAPVSCIKAGSVECDRAGECIVQHRVDAADRVRSAFSAEYLRCAV